MANILELRDAPQLAGRVLQLAKTASLDTVYDAYYPALAEELVCDLWTADARFFRAVHLAFPRVELLSGFVGS